MRLSPLSLLDQRLAPPPDPARLAFLKAQPFAHRGLHGPNIIENSRAAFNAAIAAGHGIELDVRTHIYDGVFVFHDETIERLTDGCGRFADLPTATRDALRLKGSDETIPRLSEILDLVAGQVPILIEIKAPEMSVGALCLSVRRALEGYRGAVAVMSFNPGVARWFHDHAPRIVRGLVVTEEGKRGLRGRWERHLSLWRAKPDFLAYDIRDLPSRFASSQRARGLPVLTWTVRTAEQQATAKAYAEQPIYERVAE